jgi:transcriptional regulator
VYVPRHFAIEDIAVAHEVMRQNSFALLVTNGTRGLEATHLPTVLDPARGELGTVRAHIARANRQWEDFGSEAMLVFAGQHGYISPSWYVPGPAVPTWDYVAIHAYGVPSVVADDEDAVLVMLQELVEQYEAGYAERWTLDTQDREWLRKLARGIVAFEMAITRLDAKAKLGQNNPQHQAGVVAALEGLGAHALAALVREANGL